jgi:hypothetical protein
MVDGVSGTEISQGADATAHPVVLGDERGELLAIDLRDDVVLVEYTRTVDRRWSVLLLLVALNALDVITTVAVISAGGSENNPLMRPFVEAVWPAVALKATVLITIAWLLARCEDSRRIEMMMVFATGWYLAVVSWNVTVLALA